MAKCGSHMVKKSMPSRMQTLDLTTEKKHLKPRHKNSHKRDFGVVKILGGAPGMSGAAILAGTAALKTGSGLVTLLTHPTHAPYVNLNRPELMVGSIEKIADLKPHLQEADVIAVGPGLSQSEWAETLFEETLKCPATLVVDADGLNLLAKNPHRRDNWILTPHPGEAARLLALETSLIQKERTVAAEEIQKKYGGVVVLKGHDTLICNQEQQLYKCPYGNPHMATAGMGDVLTGIIASLVGQGLPLNHAATLGTCLHSEAADRILEKTGQPFLASHVINWLEPQP